MNFFKALFQTKKSPVQQVEAYTIKNAKIDLHTLSFETIKLGQAVPPDYIFKTESTLQDDDNDTLLQIEDGALSSIFITIDSFSGTFTKGGIPIPITDLRSPNQIKAHFGEPYWTDIDDEMILFYEYNQGEFEVQFEFGSNRALEIITLTHFGVLSSAEQREAYQIDKPWPPEA